MSTIGTVIFVLLSTIILNFLFKKYNILIDQVNISKHKNFIQNKKTPLSGGLVIFLVLFYFLPESYKYFTIIMFIIFLSGLLSDLNILHAPLFRIFFQTIVVIVYLVLFDNKTPLYISIVSVTANIILSLILIQSMREMGIALATAMSAWINSFLLYFILKIKGNITLDSRLVSNGYKIIICSVAMSITCYVSKHIFFPNMSLHSTILNIGSLTIAIAINIIVYICMIFLLKVLTINELKGYIKK